MHNVQEKTTLVLVETDRPPPVARQRFETGADGVNSPRREVGKSVGEYRIRSFGKTSPGFEWGHDWERGLTTKKDWNTTVTKSLCAGSFLYHTTRFSIDL